MTALEEAEVIQIMPELLHTVWAEGTTNPELFCMTMYV